MRNKFILIPTILLLISSCKELNNSNNTTNKINNNIKNKIIDIINLNIPNIDGYIYQIASKDIIINGDTTKATIKYDSISKEIIILSLIIIPRKDRLEGIYYEKTYFSMHDKYIITIYGDYNGAIKNYIYFNNDRSVYVINQAKEKYNMTSLDTFASEAQISSNMKTIDEFIHYFGKYKYHRIAPSINSMPILTTLINTEIKNTPNNDSTMYFRINKNSHLIYLDFNYNNNYSEITHWGWYKVATEDKKKIGWINASPEVVAELTDENWE